MPNGGDKGPSSKPTPTLAPTGGNPVSPPHHAPFGRGKYREVKKWGTKQSEDGWTCKLLGLNWNENGVEETWEWTPPPTPGVADGQAVGATKRTRTKGNPSKGKTATKKDSKKGKRASKASKDNKGKASRTTRGKACK